MLCNMFFSAPLKVWKKFGRLMLCVSNCVVLLLLLCIIIHYYSEVVDSKQGERDGERCIGVEPQTLCGMQLNPLATRERHN